MGQAPPAVAATNFLTETFLDTALVDGADWVSGGGGGSVACLTARADLTPSESQPIPGCDDPAIEAGGAGALRLTPALNNRTGFALFNRPLPTAGGLDVTFKLAMWGGSGADGVSFFLVDGDTELTEPGQFGGFLGYGGNDDRGPGVDNGLIGVGFDVFGNFVTADHEDPACATGLAATPNRVSVRGPGNGTSGYCLLATSGAVDFSGASRAAATVDVIVHVDPSTDPDPEIDVSIDGANVLSVDTPAAYDAAGTFKFGFAGATGGSTNNHDVWNLDVDSVQDVDPVLGLTIAADATPIAKGGTYTLTYTGGTTSEGWTLDAADAEFTLVHDLPAGVTFTGTYSGTGWSCIFSLGDTRMTCTLSHGTSMEPDEDLPTLDADILVSSEAATGADVALTSTLSAAEGAFPVNGEGPLLVVDTADLSTSIAGPTSARVGNALSYAVTVTNAGPQSAEDSSLVVTLTAPATSVATSTAGCGVAGLVVTCTLSPMASESTHPDVVITASSGTTGTIDLTAVADDGTIADPDGATDTHETVVSRRSNNDDDEIPPEPPVETDPSPEQDPPSDPEPVQRVSGHDRSSTAAQLAMSYFEPGLPVVYVARDDTFPDALTGTPIAYRDGAPILLTDTYTLTPATADVLRTLKPGHIVVLGGVEAVSDEVVKELGAFALVSRIAGRDRFGTAAEISRARFPGTADLVLIANGATFPDALCAGAAASRANASVLLTGRDALPKATADELLRLQAPRIVVLGGPAAVSPGVLAAIEELTGATPERISGATRYETAAAITAAFFPGTVTAAFVAAGEGFADALTAGPVASRLASAVLIVPRDSLPAAVEAELRRMEPVQVIVVGGKGAVSAQTESAIEAARG